VTFVPSGGDARDDVLASVPYFSALSPPELRDVLRLAKRRRMKAGEMLFVQGEPAAGLFIVVEGMVKLFRTSPDGKEQVLRHMPRGESFNEVPVFDGGENPVSAACVEDGELLVLSRETVAALLRAYPAFSDAVVRVLASRLRHLVALVEDLSFRQVTGRVARVLLQSVAPHEGVGAGAERKTRVTQREIAEMTGTSREVAARALRMLEETGAIKLSRTGVRVVDAARLRSVGES
jgi:CRP/FNR family transcriptional regulator